MKNENHFPNVLSKLEAEEKELLLVFGLIMKASSLKDQTRMSHLSFEKILSGCTPKRLLALVPRILKEGQESSRDLSRVFE